MLAEPATTLTDYGIALETLLFALVLGHRGGAGQVYLWASAFGSVSLAALLGGTYHGFADQLSQASQGLMVQGVALALASFWAVAAAVWATRSSRRTWLGLAGGKLALALALIGSSWGFAIQVIDYLSALALVLGLYGWKTARPGAGPTPWSLGWMMMALAISGLAALVLALPRLVSSFISPVAGYHLVQMVALYCLYRGVSRRG